MDTKLRTSGFNKLSRIPKRLKEDKQIITLFKNWREILRAKLFRTEMPDLYFRNGFVLHAPPEAGLAFLFEDVWLNKVYEQKGYEIGKNDFVLDIGANIGVFTLYAAMKAEEGEILAFEPFPANADFLRRNIKESSISNVFVFQKAVTGAKEMRQLNVSDTWIRHSLNSDMPNINTIAKIDIECVALDDILREKEVCDLLKLDCEGSEYETLYGSSPDTMRKIRRVVGEYHEVDSSQKNGAALRQFFKENNFQIDCFYALDESSGIFRVRRV